MNQETIETAWEFCYPSSKKSDEKEKKNNDKANPYSIHDHKIPFSAPISLAAWKRGKTRFNDPVGTLFWQNKHGTFLEDELHECCRVKNQWKNTQPFPRHKGKISSFTPISNQWKNTQPFPRHKGKISSFTPISLVVWKSRKNFRKPVGRLLMEKRHSECTRIKLQRRNSRPFAKN